MEMMNPVPSRPDSPPSVAEPSPPQAGELALADILDIPAIQGMMDQFHALTGFGVGIFDLHGNRFVATGWQDICTKFHRVHPEACQHCLESDATLSSGVELGQFKQARCQNHLWDIVTPIVVGGRHVGNLFLGQFFYDDEVPDLEVFRAQARRYGFAEKEYLAALDRVPRWNRAKVAQAMAFYAGFARQISELGYRNFQLTQALAARQQAEAQIRLHAQLLESVRESVVASDLEGKILYWSHGAEHLYGYPAQEVLGKPYRNYAGATTPPEEAAFRQEIIARGSWQGEHLQRNRTGGCFWTSTFISLVTDEQGRPAGFIGIDQDITARKRAEEALQGSETRYRTFINATSDLVFLKDEAFRYLISNRANCAFLGKSEEDVTGRTDFDLMPREAAERCRASDQEALRQGTSVVSEETAGGSTYQTVKFPVILPGGRTGVGGYIRDITEQKQADETLRKSEAQLSTALEMAHAGHWEYDVASDTFTFNDNFYRIFRTTAAQMGGYQLSSAEYARRFCHPEDRVLVGRETRAALESADPGYNRQLEHRILYADGTTGHLAVRFFIVKDAQGRTVKTYGVNQDITERKQVEEKLRASERRFKLLFESMSSGFALHEIILDAAGTPCDYRFLQVNPAFEALTGLQADALIGRTVREVLPHTESVWIERYGQVALTGEPVTFESYSGELDRHYQVTAYRPQPGQFAVLVSDITELKRTEAALCESEALHRSILNASPDDITVADLEGRVLMASPAAQKMFNPHPAQPMVGRSVVDFIAPADRARAAADIARMLQGAFSGPGEYRALRDDGSLFDIEVNGEFIRDETGQPLRMVLIARDITARKQAEEALRESEQRHRDYLAHSPYGIFVADEQGRLVQVNPAACRITGFSEKELLAMTVPDLHGEEGRKEAARHFQTVDREGKATGELKFRPKSGESRWWLVSAVKISATRFLGFCNDITDRKRAEERLRASEEQYRDIATNIPGVIYQLQTGRTGALEVTYMSAACEALFEQPLAGLDFSALLFDRMHAGDRALFQHSLAKAAKNMARWNLEFRILPAPDRVKWLRGSANPRKLPNGALVWSGVLLDITELKLAAESLREREAFQNLLMDTIPSPVFYKDRQGRYLGFNKAFEAFYGQTKDQLVGKSVFDIAPPELARIYQEKDAGLLENPGTQIYEAPMRDAAGNLHDVVFHKASIVDAQGEVTGLIGIILDITARKRAETEILNLSKFPQENPSPVLRVDQAGVLLYSNPPGRALLAKWRIDVGATVPEPWLGRIRQALESAQLDVRDEDAGDRIFSVSISPVVNSGYVNIYALDITERKRAEEQVTRQLDELRRWQTVTLGREGRVAELKREVNALAVRLGQPPPYPSAEAT